MHAHINSLDGPIDSYVALAPRVLRAGQTENISVSLFSGQQPANGKVQLILAKNGQTVTAVEGDVRGKTDIAMRIPTVSEGDYQLQLKSQGFEASSLVRVEEGIILFVETDKPIYKPGQTVHIRVLTLVPQLKPLSGATTIEVSDAKGSKVFKKDVNTDDYGMASIDMPLSSEPNLGVWKIIAKTGKKTTQIDVRIERYVLPKYEVKVDLPKEWVLAGEQIKGTVSAEYSYGKPVQGEMQIRALRYVGSWQEFANITRNIDGKLDFELPGVQYVSGVPNAGGQGNIQLEITVREKATGYEEKTTQLLTVSASPVTFRLIPESVIFKPELPLSLLVVAETPDKKPVDATVNLHIIYTKNDFKTSQEDLTVDVKNGKSMAKVMPPKDAISLTMQAYDRKNPGAQASLAMQSGYSPSGTFITIQQAHGSTLKVGDTAHFKISSTKEAKNFYYEVLSRGSVVFSDFSQSPDISFTVTPQMAPTSRLLVYQILPTSEVAADYMPFTVDGTYPQKVDVAFNQPEVKPGDQVNVNVTTEGPARVALAAVDRSVFILAENRLNLQQVFAELERLYQQPQVELHSVSPSATILSRGAKEIFTDAGVVVMSNKQVPAGKEYSDPRRKLGANGMGAPLAAATQKEAADTTMAVPAAAPTSAQSVAKDQNSGLAEVQRIRQFFPETWIWADLLTDGTGKATKQFTTPDNITTWMLRAVALSKHNGLGVSEA
jgi:CD109 antigen